MISELNKEIKNRLNVNIDEQISKSYLTFKFLESKCIKFNKDEKFFIPSLLLKDLNDICEKYFCTLSLKRKQTKLNQLLFIPIVLFNGIYRRLDDDRERLLYEDGYQLSKELLTSTMSPYDLYKVKKILINENIIQEIKWDEDFLFSIDKKKAIKYTLNLKYKDTKIEEIQNKYALNFSLLLKNKLASGSKKNSLRYNYLPFNTFEKNLQFYYQKNMYFDKDEFQKILDEKYPNATKIFEKRKLYDKETYKEVSMILSYFNALNMHAFKCTESYGRIYMPFQLINKDFRSAIRIGNNEEIFELFDIHCCFINLSAKIIKENNVNDKNLIEECEKIIELTNKDIYQNIIDWYLETEPNNITRNKIKKNIMMWIFSNKKERRFFKSKFKEVKIIDLYFKNNFPLYYSIVTNYKTITKKEENRHGELINKYISKLSIDCFQYESDLMLNNIIPGLEHEYKDIPFISLHDAIFIPKRFNDLKNELIEKIIILIKNLKIAISK